MSVIAVRKDPQALTMTIEAEFDASIETSFPSAEAMEQVLAMGTLDGQTQAVGQIDAILAEDVVARH